MGKQPSFFFFNRHSVCPMVSGNQDCHEKSLPHKVTHLWPIRSASPRSPSSGTGVFSPWGSQLNRGLFMPSQIHTGAVRKPAEAHSPCRGQKTEGSGEDLSGQARPFELVLRYLRMSHCLLRLERATPSVSWVEAACSLCLSLDDSLW